MRISLLPAALLLAAGGAMLPLAVLAHHGAVDGAARERPAAGPTCASAVGATAC